MSTPDFAFLYDPSLAEYELSGDHPFKPVRLELTRTLLEATNLLTEAHYAAPNPISEEKLAWLHDPDYIRAVKRVSAGKDVPDAFGYGLGTADNPVFPGMHEAVLGVCAATVTAVDLVASGRVKRAANLSGGLHHALAGKASGFCVYSDLGVATEHAVREYGFRVAYVDLDAHHGDGVQWLFYERPDVLTISLHESGRYLFPGTGHTYEVGKGKGRGRSVNLPLEPYTEDASYLEAVESVLPTYLGWFKPDLIILQAGADMHALDPLADLSISVQAQAESYRRVVELADSYCGGRLVVTGGGGYDPYRTVPRSWASLWAAVTNQALPDKIPKSWRSHWQVQSPVGLPRTISDDLTTWEPKPRRADIESHNRAVIRRLHSTHGPIWQEELG